MGIGKKGFKSAIIWYFGEKNKKVKNENGKCEFRQILGIFWVKWFLIQNNFKITSKQLQKLKNNFIQSSVLWCIEVV